MLRVLALLLAVVAAADAQADVEALLQVDPGQSVQLNSEASSSVFGEHLGLAYEATEVMKGSAVNVAIKASNQTVSFFIDCAERSVTINGFKGLTNPQAKMQSLYDNLAKKLEPFPAKFKRCDAQVMLMKSAGYLANTKDIPDWAIGGNKKPHPEIKCLVPWTEGEAVYDGKDKVEIHTKCIVGSTIEKWTCVGHCGPGCGHPFGEYTQACLNHAVCCLNNKMDGCYDGACGEEWDKALIDYYFASFECVPTYDPNKMGKEDNTR